LSARRTERHFWPGSASTTAIAARTDEDPTGLEMDQSAAIHTSVKENKLDSLRNVQNQNLSKQFHTKLMCAVINVERPVQHGGTIA